jgi:cytolethal distending toxin subunit A
MDACSRARPWLSTGLLTLGLLAAAGEFVSHASTSAAGEELMLVNVRTGKCLTIAGGVGADNNVSALRFDCDDDSSRRWMLRLKL